MLYSNKSGTKLLINLANTESSISSKGTSGKIGISKIAKVRRIVYGSFLNKTKDSGLAVKQKMLSFRRSVLFYKNAITIGEISLLQNISSKHSLFEKYSKSYSPAPFLLSSLRNTTLFFSNILNIFFYIKRALGFSIAKRYFIFFHKLSDNYINNAILRTMASKFEYSLSFSRYVSDGGKLNLTNIDLKSEISSFSNLDIGSNSGDGRSRGYIFNKFKNTFSISWSGLEGRLWGRVKKKSQLFNSKKVTEGYLNSEFAFGKLVGDALVTQINVTKRSKVYFGSLKLAYGKNKLMFSSIPSVFGFVSSFYGKNLFRAYERSFVALNYIIGRGFSSGFFYKNSADLVNQSFGNLGYKFRSLMLRNSLYFKYIYNRYSIIGESLERGIADLYSDRLSFILGISENRAYLDRESEAKSLVSPMYVNWAKAGYVVLNGFGTFESKISVVSDNVQNFNITSDSKVFGHPFHLVNPSILPLTLSFVFFTLIQDILSSFCLEMWYVSSFSVIAHASMAGLFFSVIVSWMFEIYSEEQAGYHTLEVQGGFKYAILLFILSELMLFVSFFWAYFHFSLNSNSFTGGTYAPRGIIPFYATRIPFLNTLLLLSSGLSLTIAHTLIVESDKLVKAAIWVEVLSSKVVSDWNNIWVNLVGGYTKPNKIPGSLFGLFFVVTDVFYKRSQQLSVKYGLGKKLETKAPRSYFDGKSVSIDKVGRLSNDFQVNLPKSFLINFKNSEKSTLWQPNYWILDTVLKGFVFLIFQAYEYTSCMFSMNDTVYGAVFFSLTGLHGIHVFIGVMFLFFSLLVNLKKNLSKSYFNSKEEYNVFLGKYNNSGVFLKSSLNSKVWTHRVAFDGAAWYWHFVDVVWFFVFVFVYVWGFTSTSYFTAL